VPRRNHLVDLFSRKKCGGHTCFIEFYVEVGRLLLFTELPRRVLLGSLASGDGILGNRVLKTEILAD
jgi:hypothetical protein